MRNVIIHNNICWYGNTPLSRCLQTGIWWHSFCEILKIQWFEKAVKWVSSVHVHLSHVHHSTPRDVEIWMKFSVATDILMIRNLAGTLQNPSMQALSFEWAGDICIFKFLLAFEIRNTITLKFHLQRATRFLHKYSKKDEDASPVQTHSSFLNTRLWRS